jgi:hypothetical protein
VSHGNDDFRERGFRLIVVAFEFVEPVEAFLCDECNVLDFPGRVALSDADLGEAHQRFLGAGVEQRFHGDLDALAIVFVTELALFAQTDQQHARRGNPW